LSPPTQLSGAVRVKLFRKIESRAWLEAWDKSMGKITLSLVALAAVAGSASAADLPAKAPMYQPPGPAYNWTGF